MVRVNKKAIIYGSLAILLFFVVGIGMLAGTALMTLAAYSSELSSKEQLMNRNKSGLLLEDREGKPFFAFYPAQTEAYLQLPEISLALQQAVVAAEDRTFATNPGFSLKGLVRAFWVNLKTGKITQGGSTISQGLIKNSLLSSKRNFLRKWQEIVLAYALNQRYSKAEILEMYLNSVYFGEGAFGAESAAKTYFGVSARELTLAQAALLAGLLPAPADYSPLNRGPEVAEERQQLVLQQMVDQGFITSSDAVRAQNEKLRFLSKKDDLNTYGHHFAMYVRDQLVKRFGEEEVLRSGFTVKTTLNSDWQQKAEAVVASQVKALAKNGATNGASVAIDPRSGEILAMVGSVNWNNDEFGKVNMAVTPRQVGSAFKPIIYAAAFEDGILTPASILQDKPTEFPRNYKPKNYDGAFRGPVTVRRALANSLNVPSVEVMQQVGVSGGLMMARTLGISTLGGPSDYGLSLVLGTGEVNLLELTNAYGVFAANGTYHKPLSILEVRDKYNTTVEQIQPSSSRVLSEGVSYLISSILSDTKTRAEEFGTALNIPRTAAVKTGTSQDYRTALTVGYTPDLVIGVWVGNNDNSPMDKVAGSLGAAPIWKQLMMEFLAGKPDAAFTPPGSVVAERVCPYINFSSSPASQSAYTEYFIAGSQTSDPCSTTAHEGEVSVAGSVVAANEDVNDEEVEFNEEEFMPPSPLPIISEFERGPTIEFLPPELTIPDLPSLLPESVPAPTKDVEEKKEEEKNKEKKEN